MGNAGDAVTVPPPGERLTPRARAYMVIVATRHVLVGLVCIAAPGTFRSGSYSGIKQALPFGGDASLCAWGVMFAATGLLAAYAAWSAGEQPARFALLWSVITSAFWVGGFGAAWAAGDLAGWTGPIIWATVTAKDCTMLRSPLRNPFEPVVRKVLDTDGRR